MPPTEHHADPFVAQGRSRTQVHTHRVVDRESWECETAPCPAPLASFPRRMRRQLLQQPNVDELLELAGGDAERALVVLRFVAAQADSEERPAEAVFTRKVAGPRDVVLMPEWAPDSSRVVFAAFEQATDHIEVLESQWVDDAKDTKAKDDASSASCPL